MYLSHEIQHLLEHIRIETKQVEYAIEGDAPIPLKGALDAIWDYVSRLTVECEPGRLEHRPGCPVLLVWDIPGTCTCIPEDEDEENFAPDHSR